VGLPSAVTITARSGLSAAPRPVFRTPSLFLLLLCVGAAFGRQASPSSSDSEIAHADQLLHAGKPQDALTVLNELAASAPNTPHLEARIGKAYFQSNQFQKAVPHLRLAVQQNESDTESVQLLALTYFVAGQYAEAVPLFEKLGPHLSDNTADGPYLLASCYTMTQRWNDARTTYAKLFSVPPDSAMAYLVFGKFLIRQRLEDRAVGEIQTALKLDPEVPMAHFLLGEIDLYKGDSPGAVAEFNKELAVNPSIWLVYWRLGDAYVRLEKYDDAETALRQAIWLNETSSGAYILLGQVALKKNDPAAAAAYLETAVKLDPQNDYVHYFLGKAYQGLGRTVEANQHYAISRQLRNNKRADERTAAQSGP
jgi:tetratricopeptide (TPR) repeat protein